MTTLLDPQAVADQLSAVVPGSVRAVEAPALVVEAEHLLEAVRFLAGDALDLSFLSSLTAVDREYSISSPVSPPASSSSRPRCRIGGKKNATTTAAAIATAAIRKSSVTVDASAPRAVSITAADVPGASASTDSRNGRNVSMLSKSCGLCRSSSNPVGNTFPSSVANPLASNDPNTATPIAPPNCRKNCSDAVATPSTRYDSVFCTARL